MLKFIKSGLFLICIAISILSLFFTSCSTISAINKTEKTAGIGSAAGSAIGAVIGKRAGNTVVGATIGAALGSTTGSFIGRRLDNLTANKKNTPLYVIDGVPYRQKTAQNKLINLPEGEIESVIILKNEEAVALYGDKGENGAILIALRKI
jgi:hypothetical protein